MLQHPYEHQLALVHFQAMKWTNYVIFVANIANNWYYVYILRQENVSYANPPHLMPIQKLSMKGKAQSISFLDFEQNVYCLIGSVFEDDSRYVFPTNVFQMPHSVFSKNSSTDLHCESSNGINHSFKLWKQS